MNKVNHDQLLSLEHPFVKVRLPTVARAYTSTKGTRQHIRISYLQVLWGAHLL